MHAFSCVVFGWHCVKNYDGVLQVHGLHCIEGSGVLHPRSCRMLGHEMHRNARYLDLAEACMPFFVLYLVGNV